MTSVPRDSDSTFANAVVLTKHEVFDALEACADAERALLRAGRAPEAAGVASLFELLEDRVILDPAHGLHDLSSKGSNSSDRELMQ
ncbi:MAG TPA: hypothetical protein VK386_02140 [Acidimicrobiales bacterium]|nr:hypothetical protein [Acidimicrobiales bacterium]